MRVLIVGGYGVFGGRLGELLLRDGHEVIIAGRDLAKAQRWIEAHGGTPLALDLDGDLGPIREAAPRVVIDAAGPFQHYGGGHRLVRFCIGCGIDYLDLCDDATFTRAVAALDAEAKAARCFALSGASSAPGLSSAVAAALAEGLDRIDVIESAILPGNRAPRGRSVIAAVLSQVGGPMRVWRGNAWRRVRAWSERRAYRLDARTRRVGWLLSVPDLELFPEEFGARSVVFRAGMELAALNAGVSLVAGLRRVGALRSATALTRTAHAIARRLEPFGSDRGGMIVRVTGPSAQGPVRRTWRLVAEAGEGPYIPAVVVRALLRRIDQVATGARACLNEVPLAEIENAMSDLAVATVREETPRPTLFQYALGDRWGDLAPAVRRLHGVQDVESFSGRATVERGSSSIARLAAWFFDFPHAGENVPLTITKTRTRCGEIWERNFAGRVFRSYLTPSRRACHYRERFWLLNCEQELPVENGAMELPVRRGWVLGVPLPAFLLPGSKSREYEVDGVFHFDVGLYAPLGGGLIVRYRGWVRPEGGS